jgi:hypothetical protein
MMLPVPATGCNQKAFHGQRRIVGGLADRSQNRLARLADGQGQRQVVHVGNAVFEPQATNGDAR